MQGLKIDLQSLRVPTHTPDNRYKLGSPKEKGGEGTIYFDHDYAIKVVYSDSYTAKNFKRIFRMIPDHRKHHIVAHYEIQCGSIYSFIIMERAKKSLVDFCLDYFDTPCFQDPESILKPIFRQLIAAIVYCHLYNITPLDIKPDNFLLLESGEWALTDFIYKYSGYIPKQAYAPPSHFYGYNKACDIWAFGASIKTCVGHFRLSMGWLSQSQQLMHLFSLTVECSDPLQIPSAEDIASHPWLSDS